ncbi:glycerophosphodiester phosphodiesterase [Lactobacillus mulieris]|uniref:Glycerophosphodiester phosphodiesterase n=1 Tax=Lactobacillus mulieris TaxID=2508708 RepID=A0AAW5X0B7_9LACO|nr:glycerophosphodiester phosphodiesterase [Lactobacillus mulieris]MCZ3622885.1 glycerophosphodiester phosphodiesterase [Lactobacillus mulieris]MCZ3624565.1 glycerophosphodiester phosphodiesterase [Lactobacillus mulieris]MCZ3636890.1 glycerophosphodiester phosphodiesterase [Lactobacillus mulieris]MCZ3690198.1 glycerophosphodiester phosphodiesterase [Lactobacillus mulieris]MCZ3696851.1 glycerophosphodiester phosphodiesterase [Lactobacillus mulieris]
MKNIKSKGVIIFSIILALFSLGLGYWIGYTNTPKVAQANNNNDNYIKKGINLEKRYQNYINYFAAKHVISHRGSGANDEVEHTFAAYNQAIDSGSHYIEQDLVSSKEGTLWVSHDPSARRIFHCNQLFRDMTDSEIEELKTSNNEHCHRLSEVFNHYKKDKDVNFVVEVRTKWDFNQIPTLVKTIHKCKIPVYRLIIQCWTKEDAARIKSALPQVKTLFLCGDYPDFEEATKDSNIDIVAPEEHLAYPQNIKFAHKHNKKFCTWTIDSSTQIKQAIKNGVDYYFTNYSAKAIDYEKIYRCPSFKTFLKRNHYKL